MAILQGHVSNVKAPKPNPIKKQPTRLPINMGTSAMAEEPRNCGKLDAYSMDIQAINSSVEYYGGHTSVDIDMKIRTHITGESALSGSKALGNFEDFMRDIAILNNIKKSEHPGVEDLWKQIQEFLVLTDKKDK